MVFIVIFISFLEKFFLVKKFYLILDCVYLFINVGGFAYVRDYFKD